MKKKMLGFGMVLMFGYGCNTAMVNIPGVGNIMQPKDVTIGSPGIEYSNPDGTKIKIQNYTSNANVAAMQVQANMLANIAGEAVKAAIGASIPGINTPSIIAGEVVKPK